MVAELAIDDLWDEDNGWCAMTTLAWIAAGILLIVVVGTLIALVQLADHADRVMRDD